MSQGEEGKPGESVIGQQGGKGGEGGKGGAGEPEGVGGAGGAGGKGAEGKQGPQGAQGKTGLSRGWRIGQTVWIIAFTLLVVWGLLVANTARLALCDQRDDLNVRIVRTQAILDPQTAEEREEAKIIFKAIPRRLIAQGQETNENTSDNLETLDDAWYIPDC